MGHSQSAGPAPRPPSPTRSTQVSLPREVKMFAITTVTAALLVLATTAQAATKYNYGGRDSYAPSYKHRVYGREYKRFDPYESHYAEEDYRPHHDSYDEGYGGHAYSEEPTYTYEPIYRQERSAKGGREGQQSLLFTPREAQQFPSCIGKCITKGPTDVDQVPCSAANLATGGRPFCYVSELCKDARRSVINKDSLWSTEACCGDTPAPCPGPDFGRGP